VRPDQDRRRPKEKASELDAFLLALDSVRPLSVVMWRPVVSCRVQPLCSRLVSVPFCKFVADYSSLHLVCRRRQAADLFRYQLRDRRVYGLSKIGANRANRANCAVHRISNLLIPGCRRYFRCKTLEALEAAWQQHKGKTSLRKER
jgi:hypothetical protein